MLRHLCFVDVFVQTEQKLCDPAHASSLCDCKRSGGRLQTPDRMRARRQVERARRSAGQVTRNEREREKKMMHGRIIVYSSGWLALFLVIGVKRDVVWGTRLIETSRLEREGGFL